MIRPSSAVKLGGFFDGFALVGGWNGVDGNLMKPFDHKYNAKIHRGSKHKKRSDAIFPQLFYVLLRNLPYLKYLVRVAGAIHINPMLYCNIVAVQFCGDYRD